MFFILFWWRSSLGKWKNFNLKKSSFQALPLQKISKSPKLVLIPPYIFTLQCNISGHITKNICRNSSDEKGNFSNESLLALENGIKNILNLMKSFSIVNIPNLSQKIFTRWKEKFNILVSMMHFILQEFAVIIYRIMSV